MTKPTHTPGPWRITKDLDGHAIKAGPRHYPLVVATAWGGLRPHETKGNARLIAAAPDLLAALTQLVERLTEAAEVQRQGITGEVYCVRTPRGEDFTTEVLDAEAAIRKAEGRDE